MGPECFHPSLKEASRDACSQFTVLLKIANQTNIINMYKKSILYTINTGVRKTLFFNGVTKIIGRCAHQSYFSRVMLLTLELSHVFIVK